MREVPFRGDGFELPLLVSDLIPPGFRHGFTTRGGGVSAAPFDSLNLGGKWGDAPGDVAENRRRFVAAAGAEAVYLATQVHGRDVAVVGAESTPASVGAARADAVLTKRPRTPVGVLVADCVPILIADAVTGACAAVHAGWRGTVAGVLPAALAEMTRLYGTRAADVRVALGPSIGSCCFEVGDEVVAAVEAAFGAARTAGAIVVRSPRAHVDLWLLNRLAAEAAGVPATSIDVGALCTSCARERFFSYRRDRGNTGQLGAFIARAD